ncbi:MAG: hypothetical protein AAF637_01160 [Pseudomonadota bacterium]
MLGALEAADEVDSLRLLIHQATLEPSRWQDALASLKQLLGARSSQVVIFDRGSLGLNFAVACNIDPEAEQGYREHWHKHDVWLHAALGLGAGTIVTGEDIVPSDQLRSSDIYNDYLRHYDVARMVAALVENDARVISAVVAHRGTAEEEFGGRERKILRALTPHLATSCALQVHLGSLENRVRATEAALDRLPVAICLIDHASELVYRNRMAQRMLAADDGLSERGLRLCAAQAKEQKELATRIAEAAATGIGSAAFAGTILSVSRPSLRRPYSVLVAPLAANRDVEDGIIGTMRPCAMVLITDPEQQPEYPSAFLAQRYSLTSAEARLACELVAGSSLQEAADSFGVAIGTVRGQLKQIFAKTDVNRQSELIRLLTSDLAAQAVQMYNS